MAVPIAFNWIKFGKFMLFPKGSTERNSKHESSTKEINVFSDDKKASLEMDETDPSEALAKFKRLRKWLGIFKIPKNSRAEDRLPSFNLSDAKI